MNASRLDDPRERYRHDVEFKRLVDCFYSLVQNRIPSETREALMLAHVLIEQRRPVNFRYLDGLEQELDRLAARKAGG